LQLVLTDNVTVYRINPITDARWSEFVERHPSSSVFHTSEWIQTLLQTYGFEPFVLTTTPPGLALTNGIPFCQVSSWLGSRRLVSLPFSDHCVPLVDDADQMSDLLVYLQGDCELEGWKGIELRTGSSIGDRSSFGQGSTFWWHKLNLQQDLDQIFDNLHKDCIQRKIQRAEREHLVQEHGSSEELLNKFYHLLLKTRRRHGLPPQPFIWFHNLIACLGEKAQIRVASKADRPVAGILTLRHKQSLVYKYGCSDEKFNHLGGMQMLLWNAIQEAKNEQLHELDLGRSDLDQEGLITFKDRWGATRTKLVYQIYPRNGFQAARSLSQAMFSKLVFAWMPDSLLAASGRALYKYMG
jgi:CelD/BcsL family acetyltransferase involved in cellulose biosynthesis